MYKIVFDSDGLIKLIKAGIPKDVFRKFKSFITNEVYSECVTQGKESLFEDAFIIENMVEEDLIQKKQTGKNTKAKEILTDKNFGKGEESSVHLYYETKADAICSDDDKFLNLLSTNNVPFIISPDLIVRLNEVKSLSKEQSLKVLEGLKPFIKEEDYVRFKKQIR